MERTRASRHGLRLAQWTPHRDSYRTGLRICYRSMSGTHVTTHNPFPDDWLAQFILTNNV